MLNTDPNSDYKQKQSYLTTDIKVGLNTEIATKRLDEFGENVIQEKHVNPWLKFLSYFWGPIPWMIEVAVILSAIAKRWEEFFIICLMLLINASVGFWQEHKADNAIAALKKKLALGARVLRDGKWTDIPAGQLVIGDIVLIKLGNIIPADLKLLKGEYLNVDQSALTGESLPVEKNIGDIVYSSSIVRLGEMIGIVIATGMNTYFGKTAKLVESAKKQSHFQKAVLKIGNYLIIMTLCLVVVILTITLLRHDPLIDTILFALILTIAAIPVALPAVLSVTMAVGALRLARMDAIVSKLVSIEELAGMDILCSDKTGTLTKNKLTLGEPFVVLASNEEELLTYAALACQQQSDDVIDKTILKFLPKNVDITKYETIKFIPFDPVHKRMQAEIKHEGKIFLVTKGAPQVILTLANDPSINAEVEKQVDKLADSGYRTLGVATQLNGKWRFLGLVPLFDPPRDDCAQTIQSAERMGLDIKMLTGDHISIAKEISRKLHLGQNIVTVSDVFKDDVPETKNLDSIDGFAQVFPEHKFKIVKALQAENHIVGMTGDGVNDAPALKQADVGIAVSGATDAARSAAALVLTSPGLSVIISAIEEARKIFERMNSYSIFRIAETIRILLFISISILVFNFYPVTAEMIVLLAILNDVPIMMIAYDNAPIAQKPVRWNMFRVLAMSTVLGILGVISSFSLYFIVKNYYHLPTEMIQSILFLKLLVAGHFTIYITRNKGALWQKPWPNLKLVLTIETTQLLGTLAVVYGWFLTPIGWVYAIYIWLYALAWCAVNSIVKILVIKLFKKVGE